MKNVDLAETEKDLLRNKAEFPTPMPTNTRTNKFHTTLSN